MVKIVQVRERATDMKPQKNMKKKRKTLLKVAQIPANKNVTCKESKLSEDRKQYLESVLQLSKKNFNTRKELEIFADDSFGQIIDEEISLSKNELGKIVLVKLLPWASDEVVMRFINLFGKDLRPLVTDPCANRVVQKLIRIAGERGSCRNKDEKLGKAYDQWLLKCSKFFIDNLEDCAWVKYACHVFQSCLEALAGMKEKETQHQLYNKTGPNEADGTLETKPIPPAFKNAIFDLAQRLVLWPRFTKLVCEEMPCDLLCTLLMALRAISKHSTTSLVKKLQDECFQKQTAEEDDEKKDEMGGISLPDVFSNPKISKLLETAIIVATPQIFSKIYADFFLNNLGKLAVKKIANYPVQKLFNHCTKKLEFEAMYDEIAPFFEEIFSSKNYGIFVSIAKACQRHSTREECFVSEMMKVLHCYKPLKRQLKIAPLILNLTTFEQKGPISAESSHCVDILQTLLTFSKPIKIVDSLLTLSAEELITVFTHLRGSYILDVFMASKSIGENSREKMFGKLKGNYVKLTCSRHGSRAVDGLWAGINLDQKADLLTELGSDETILYNNKFGRIISSKYKLSMFKSKKDKWMRLQDGSNLKRKLIEDATGGTGKKKKVTSDGNDTTGDLGMNKK